jgi:hypothetical protein
VPPGDDSYIRLDIYRIDIYPIETKPATNAIAKKEQVAPEFAPDSL